MAQTIKLKRSSVTGNVPSTGQLELGELAINTFDGKVYIKKDNGTESVIEIGGGAGGAEPTQAVYKKYIYTAASSQVTFSGSDNNSNTLSYSEGYTEVYLNGIKLVSGTDYTATNGYSIVLTSGASAADTLEVIAMGGSDTINLIVSRGFNSFVYTATASQTVFSGSDDNADTLAYTAGQLQVFLNGVLLDSSDYTATNGTSITLDAGAALNDKVAVMAYSTNDIDTIGTLTIGGITYPTSDGTSGQVLVTDGSGTLSFDDAASGGIALTDLSVSTNSAGTAALSYNSGTGVFSYTPPDLSSYLTTETFTELSDDTTPQLGGDLDLNSNDITGTGNINVEGIVTQGSANYYTKQYVLHGTTTNATETEIFTITDFARIGVTTDSTMLYEISIAARRTDATGESASWHLKGCVDNFSGTVADVGNVYEIAVAQDDVSWAVDVQADDSNNALNVLVTGAAGKTVRWTAIVKTIEVTE